MSGKPPAFYLSRLRRIAARRGGELLSTTYAGDEGKLRFRCSLGHEWLSAAGAVVRGHWCHECGRARLVAARTRPAAKRLLRAVSLKGGALLSQDYRNNRTKLRYRCEREHEWEAVPASILRGGWCPRCAVEAREARRRAATARRLTGMIERRGGVVLAPGFTSFRTRMQVRCERGHVWLAAPQSIQEGVWCQECRADAVLAKMRAVAERWGGECLSKRCRSGSAQVLLRCAVGHRFELAGKYLLGGVWCPSCRKTTRGSIERMRRIAADRGGTCLSSRYVNSAGKLRWRCREGHEWSADPARIVRGHWCRRCERGFGISRRRLRIEDMRLTARERGGACLSREYHGSETLLRWRCARGHEWWARPSGIRRGRWCPRCGTKAGTIGGMRALAAEHGGRCLSRAWDDHSQPLLFECARGHRFRERGAVVKTGVWCRQCRR